MATTRPDRRRLLLVGGGKMGGALLAGWIKTGTIDPAEVIVVEPAADAGRRLRAAHGIAVAADYGEVPTDFAPDVIVLAVKPQIMDAVLPQYRARVAPGRVFLSIAAGKPIGYFERHLGADAAIVRAMPNTPAQVGRGITVLCANPRVGPAQRALCASLLEAVGEVAWIEAEADMDAVTAVSGSGPAYVFLLIETLARAGVKAGLDPTLAARLALATVSGSGELARQSGEAPEMLRRNVTSPGGTTAAALEVLMAPGGLDELMTRAVAAATRRGRELARG